MKVKKEATKESESCSREEEKSKITVVWIKLTLTYAETRPEERNPIRAGLTGGQFKG